MIRKIVILIYILTIIGIGNSQAIASKEASDVKSSYTILKNALRNGNGNKAASRVTPATLDFYEQCRRLSINSTGIDFESISQIGVVLIFQLRWLLDKETLKSMDGASVFSWGVENGLVKKNTLDLIKLDHIQVDGEKAISTLLNNGQPVTDLIFVFELHNGTWKLDFGNILRLLDIAFAKIQRESGKTKTEFAIYLIERTYNKKVPPQILNGPLK